MIPSTLVYRLTFRFKHIVLLFDMDKTGRESSSKQERLLGEFGVKRLSLPLPGTKEEKTYRIISRRETPVKIS